MRAIVILILSSFVIFHGFEVNAQVEEQVDDWSDDWQTDSKFQFSHELSYAYAHIIEPDSVNNEKAVLNELSAKSSVKFQGQGYSLRSEVELLSDQLLNKTDLEILELNLLIPFENGTDAKIGRQIITWGTGDLVFLNDLFSKDWQAFFSGRDNEKLKPAIDALRVSHYAKFLNFEIVFLPEFKQDIIPTGERFSFFVPNFGIIQPQPPLYIKQPKQAEYAARLFKNVNANEFAFYLYKGFFKSPSQTEQNGVFGYNPMQSFGASVRFPLSGGLFNAEFSSYESLNDRAGDEPFVENGQNRYLIGFEKELVHELTGSFQVYYEKLKDYQALVINSLPQQLLAKKTRSMLTLRLTQQALQQRLLNSLMLFYSPSDEDYYLRYSSRFKFTDNLKLVAGLNLLDGKEQQTFLAQMKDNSNIFMRIHYSFN